MKIIDRTLQHAIESKDEGEIDFVLEILSNNPQVFVQNLQSNTRINVLHLAANTQGLINGLLVDKLILNIESTFERNEAIRLLKSLMQEHSLFTNHACTFEDVHRMVRDHFPEFSIKIQRRPTY